MQDSDEGLELARDAGSPFSDDVAQRIAMRVHGSSPSGWQLAREYVEAAVALGYVVPPQDGGEPAGRTTEPPSEPDEHAQGKEEQMYEITKDRNEGWRVEDIDHESEGEVHSALFMGREAQQRAEEYAAFKNAAPSPDEREALRSVLARVDVAPISRGEVYEWQTAAIEAILAAGFHRSELDEREAIEVLNAAIFEETHGWKLTDESAKNVLAALARLRDVGRDAEAMIVCRRCDGCGWMEGDAPLGTPCKDCGGTGQHCRFDHGAYTRWRNRAERAEQAIVRVTALAEKRYSDLPPPLNEVWNNAMAHIRAALRAGAPQQKGGEG